MLLDAALSCPAPQGHLSAVPSLPRSYFTVGKALMLARAREQVLCQPCWALALAEAAFEPCRHKL